MFELLAVGTAGFYIFAVLLCIVVTAIIENSEGWFFPTFAFLGSVTFVNWFYNLGILSFSRMHPLYAAKLVLVYLACGVVWSFIKWYFLLHKNKVAYNKARSEFLEKNGATQMTPELAARFRETVLSIYNAPKIPRASEHKSDLIRWATYWPFSVLGFCVNDLVRKAYTWVYEILQSSYQRMADYMSKQALEDQALAKQQDVADSERVRRR